MAAGAAGQPGGQMILVITCSLCPEGLAGKGTAEADSAAAPAEGPSEAPSLTPALH